MIQILATFLILSFFIPYNPKLTGLRNLGYNDIAYVLELIIKWIGKICKFSWFITFALVILLTIKTLLK
jgi:hypothetical protein